MLTRLPENTHAPIDPRFMSAILTPYKADATYLKSATRRNIEGIDPETVENPIELISGEGEFSIDESCYIADTGHFNAVEFNICYNQLAYVLFASCFQQRYLSRLAPELSAKLDTSMETYREEQLGSMMIVKFETKFRKPIDARKFRGSIKAVSASVRGGVLFANTEVEFSDDQGGSASGKVMLAIHNLAQSQAA